jgi:hypothetical protein
MVLLRRHPLLVYSALALALWPLAAAPLAACSTHSSVWDWDRCWISVPRWLLLGLAGAGWWFLCFHRLFPLWLAPTRRGAPMPSVAFRRCLALFWLLSGLTFVVLFAWLSDELSGGTSRSFPASLGWLNRNWKWLLALVVVAGGAVVIWAPRRRGADAGRRDTPGA